MRVASSTGSAINNDTDLMREIREAIRGGPDEETVVQAIQRGNSRILAELQALVRQGGGQAAGPPAANRTAQGAPGENPHQTQLLATMERLIQRIELFSNLNGGQGAGGGQEPVYTRESRVSAYREADRLFQQFRSGQMNLTSVMSSFSGVIKTQGEASVKDLFGRFLNLGVGISSVSGQFRRLEESIKANLTGARESGAFGSNVVSPMEFFFDGYMRTLRGVLTSTDSFGTTIKSVNEALQSGMISPLMQTGRSAEELAGDFHKARADIRGMPGGFDTHAWMSTQEANKALSALVDYQARFGIQSGIADSRTEQLMAVDGNFLKQIAASTGQTVGKLEEQLQAARQQQDILIGLGRLNPQQADNFSRNQVAIQNVAGTAGKALTDQLAGLLRYGNNSAEILANSPEWRTFAATNQGMWQTMMQALDAMRSQSLTPDQWRPILSRLGSAGYGGAFQNMGYLQNPVLGPVMDRIAQFVNAGNIAASGRPPDAAQQARKEDNPEWAAIQQATEIWQEQVRVFGGLGTSIAGNIIALGLNTAAILAMPSMMRGLSGLLGGGGAAVEAAEGGGLLAGAARWGSRALRAAPLVGGVVAGVADYAETGSAARGIGTGLGAWGGAAAGAALGTMIAPVIGTAIGGLLGGLIGAWGGDKIGEMVDPGRQVGPNAPQVAAAQMVQSTDNSSEMLARLLNSNTEGVQYLAQIRAELARQTGMLTGSPSPAGAPAVGTGLSVSTVPSRASSGGRPTAGGPFSGPT
jgi:hypothetical protein